MNENYTITDQSSDYILNIDIIIENECWKRDIENIDELVVKTAKHVFNRLGFSKAIKHIEFSLTLSNNEDIAKLNSQYRGKSSPTNCLSFPADENILKKLNDFVILGDIIFAYKVIKDESLNQNKEFSNHFIHLLVHSLLHLFGYDHEVEKEALIMEALEIEILSFFNIESPY
jgi:probable rRNA maturation factor